jgi:hypothetical protein
MHVQKFLSRWLGQRNVIGHKMRAESLAKAVESLIGCGRACSTALGRNRAGDAKAKHQIKVVDLRVRRPVIVVDWSDFESVGVGEWAMLTAGVALSGQICAVQPRVSVSEVQ